MKKNSYLCAMKHMERMNGMKKLVLLAAFVAPSVGLVAQNQGIGITNTDATLHVHSYTEYGNTLPPDPNIGGRNTLEDPVGPDVPTSYRTTLLITNTNTGVNLSDGLLISQIDSNVTISQNEQGSLSLENGTGKLLFSPQGRIGIGDTYTGFKFNVEGTSRFAQNVSMVGNLSVDGTTTVGGTLNVGSGFSCDAQGNLRVKHLKVTLTNWPDYVFGGSHQLMPLGELESFINCNKHLPGVPSAEEVEKEGADLGEMNRVLMEKVEELTLYIIDLQKQIDELKGNK